MHRPNFRYSPDQGLLLAHQVQEHRSSSRMSRQALVELSVTPEPTHNSSYYFAEFIFLGFALTFPDKLDDFPRLISLRATPNKPTVGA